MKSQISHLKSLIVIVGPTGIGKTSTSILLAKHLNCEIISADSRQFYKEMSIGTAKPTPAEMDGVPHHFVDNLSIETEYTAGQFEKDALQKLDEQFLKNDVVIMVGGSGLYIDAVCNGLDDIPRDQGIRDELIKQYEKQGIEFLQNELQKIDSEYFEIVDQNNPHRMMRGLEVYRTSGQPYSTFLNRQTKKRPFNIIKIGLEMDRKKLYERINSRVDQMIEQGLEEEVRSLMNHRDKTAMKTVGYLEFLNHFDGKTSITEAIELIKRNSRRYAKRQITWFKRDEKTVWMDASKPTNAVNFIDSRLKTTA